MLFCCCYSELMGVYYYSPEFVTVDLQENGSSNSLFSPAHIWRMAHFCRRDRCRARGLSSTESRSAETDCGHTYRPHWVTSSFYFWETWRFCICFNDLQATSERRYYRSWTKDVRLSSKGYSRFLYILQVLDTQHCFYILNSPFLL